MIVALATLLAGGTSASADGPEPLLRPLVKSWDFEEAEDIAIDMPSGFYRHLAPKEGFPPYPTANAMRYADDAARSGRWSFRFELDGASLSARVPDTVINVMPEADYLVSAWVRTEDLDVARARLAAWLLDHSGNVIPGTIVSSAPVRTRGRWVELTVHVRGRRVQAADLSLELQLVQPREYLEAGADADSWARTDIRGRAWFDDIRVWHMPTLELRTGASLNLFPAGTPPTVTVAVRDLSGHHVAARLRVYDVDGVVVHRMDFEAPRGHRPRRLELPLTDAGWYRAELVVEHGDGGVSGREMIDFCILPPTPGGTAGPRRGFGVVLGPPRAEELEECHAILRALGTGSAVMPIWHADTDLYGATGRMETLARCVDRILADGVDLVFALESIPRSIADAAGVDPSELLDLLGQSPEAWRPHLDELIIRYGVEIDRWQLGVTDSRGTLADDELDRRLDSIGAALSTSGLPARITLPAEAEGAIPPVGASGTHVVHLPYQAEPERIGEYLERWRADGRPVTLVLEPLPADRFTPRQRVADLLQRGLHGWRAGVDRLMIRAPWQYDEETGLAPDPVFMAWRGLIDRLRGRRYGGELRRADGARCWIAEGNGADDAMLIAWSNRLTPDGPPPLNLMLADGPVRAIDAFGNERTVRPRDERHVFALEPTPVFIRDVSLEFARFRESFTITPDVIEAVNRLHEHEVTLKNPWNMSITGMIQFKEIEDWTIIPRVQRFDIRPFGSVTLPLSLRVARGALSGPQPVEATVLVTAEQPYTFTVSDDVSLGLQDVRFGVSWHPARNPETGVSDLVVIHTVSNTGERNVALDLYLGGPGISRQARRISILAPGASVTRTFRIEDGATILAGKQLRVGVIDRDGQGRLNHALALPPSLADMAVKLQAGVDAP